MAPQSLPQRGRGTTAVVDEEKKSKFVLKLSSKPSPAKKGDHGSGG